MNQTLTAILPCTDLDAAQAFFERLGFAVEGGPPDYRMLSDGRGGAIHLNPAVEGWLVPRRNPFGLYLYREDVDALAAAFAGEVIERGPERQAVGHVRVRARRAGRGAGAGRLADAVARGMTERCCGPWQRVPSRMST